MDWFVEMLRLRLMEVYDRSLIDEMLPYKMEHLYPFDHEITVITDDELSRIDKLASDSKSSYSNLYDISEDLLYHPQKQD